MKSRIFLHIILSVLALAICPTAMASLPFMDDEEIHAPEYYEHAIRTDFGKGEWERGKIVLDKAIQAYPDVAVFNELAGRYQYQHKNYDKARFYLIRALRADPGNQVARKLLVEVEDKTHNYSSAIAYVNELLEGEPYDRNLWTRKIDLYTKQGNELEADRLLQRLYQIYPNDTIIRRRFINRLEENHTATGREEDKYSAIERLKTLIRLNPRNEDYYLDLSNLYLQMGDDNAAIGAASQGLAVFPRSGRLLKKKAGILAELGRYPEALSLARQHGGAGMYDALLMEAARAAQDQDAYTLYGKAYQRSKNPEALNYLINTAILRGYDDDALLYLREAQKRRGKTLELRMKEYMVNKRMGNAAAANAILMDLYQSYPDNYDVAEEVANLRMAQATSLLSQALYAEAIPLLEGALTASHDAEVREAALSRLYSSYIQSKKYNQADSALERLHREFPLREDYISKKANVYALQGKTAEALSLLSITIDQAQNGPSKERRQYIESYEELAIPYIKGLMQRGAYPAAMEETEYLLSISPRSHEGLLFGINAAGGTKQFERQDSLIAMALSAYPDDILFLTKKAGALSRNHEPELAVELLRPYLDSYPGDSVLVQAFSGNTETLAYDLMKHNRADSAVVRIDTALEFDGNNHSLLYAKGIAFEKLKLYDSAYVYQNQYKPSLMEFSELRQHLKGLKSHGYHNIIGLEYLQGRYGAEDIITSVGTASFTHMTRRNSYTGTVNYAGRDGGDTAADQVPGGVGIQIQAAWNHVFSRKWAGEISAAWGNRYFPMVTASLGVTRTFDSQWELSGRLGFRMIDTYKKGYRFDESIFNEETNQYGTWTFNNWIKKHKTLFSASLGLARSFERFRVSTRADGFLLNGKPYVNGTAEGKYFPINDGETSLSLLAGVGTAPEASLIDNAMPTSFSHLNTMVGLGGRYLLTPELAIGLMGTWHTFYSQSNRRTGTYQEPIDSVITEYKNLFNIYLNVYIKF